MPSMSQITQQQRQAARTAAVYGQPNYGYYVGGYGGGGGGGGYDPYAAAMAQQQAMYQQQLQAAQAAAQQRQKLMNDLMADYNRRYNEARQANEGRYADILGRYDQLHGRAMGYLNDQGNTERQDLSDAYTQNAASIDQDMISRGLSNTTVRNSLRGGNMRRYDRSVGELNERLNRQRLDYDTGITQGRLGVMERRTDSYPDLGQYAGLMQAFGSAGRW